MPRSTIVFGNGLGMAVDSSYFSLSSGLKTVWNESNDFTTCHKLLVSTAVSGVSKENYPQSEDQLDKLQVAIVASDFLRSFETGSIKWLNDESRDLPEAFRCFVHEVASYFHGSGKFLPETFSKPLAHFITATTSHVAVLNYDNLLYDALRNTRTLDGYSGTLIDGFHKAGFSPSNLERRFPDRKAWYLHLHGSPLFIGNNKLMGSGRELLIPTEKSHIVLTHVAHKPSIIDASPILSEYWRRLAKAFDETQQIILFGYSGIDIHLNDKVITGADGGTVHVIEWNGMGGQSERQLFWEGKLAGCKVAVHLLDNILKFTDWSALCRWRP